jgi:hypothetical protein
MSSPERTQQSQGAAQFLYGTGIPKTLERMSYGDSLFSGSGGLGGTTRMRPETAEALLNVAPFAKPAAVIANRAAMTAGRAGARYAERVVPQVMERGGLQAQLLGDISRGGVSPLDVYHGTPHTLPPTPRNPLGEFDASKIGTGEGAQAYGYGIYTAEAPDVAKGYANRLGSNLIMVDGKPMDFNDPVHLAASILSDPNNAGLPAKNLASAIRYDPKGIVPFGAESKAEEIAKVLESGNIPKFTNQKGNFYKVDLPDEKIATMLDWDKPVSQQKNVMNALRNEAEQRVKNNLLPNIENDIRSKLPVQDIGNDYLSMFGNQNVAINQDIRKQALEKLNKIDLQPLVEKELNTFKPLDMNWDMSGKDFYEILSTRSGSAQQASNILQQQGVAGIKYLDEVSRSRGQGTRNFVVFPVEEKNMTILERNGMPASQIESPAFTDPFANTIGSSIR